MSVVEPSNSRDDIQLVSYQRERVERALVLLVFVVVNMALFATAPKSDDFWWSDAPRHALNGAFIKDLITAAPWHDLRQWAIACYLKYPALTILFYPPLFYFFLAPAYAVFGVSHVVALTVISLFTELLGAGTYAIVRTRFPRWSALGAALLVIDFWSDLRVMRDLSAVLQDPDFKKVARFPITGQRNPGEEMIIIYQPIDPVAQTRRTLNLEMPIIEQTFHGTMK